MPPHEQVNWRSIAWLGMYAIAMAQLEAALVMHLRTIYYPENPLALFPLVLFGERDLAIEITRELATLLMISSVSFVHSRRGVQIFGAFIYVFGLWDIAYYVWLKIMLGWPTQWHEWDVLFLIPWPWLGPWIAPVLVSVLFVASGWRLLSSQARFTPISVWPILAGVALILTAFLWSGWPLVGGEAVSVEPGGFLWPVFIAGLLVMMLGLGILSRFRPPTTE